MREGIRDKVAVIGVGCCKFGENWDQSPSDMIVDAAYEAYADAKIEDPQRQIDAVFTGSLYSQKGPHECSDALKLWKPVTMVSNYCATGTDAFRCGVFAIAAGMYDTVLVVGYDKPKDRGVSGPSVMLDEVRAAQDTRGLVLAGGGALLRQVRRHPRGSRPHRHQEPPQRHARAELVPQARDHPRRVPAGAHDLVAVRALRLRRADRRRRGGGADARDLAASIRDDAVLVKAVSVWAGPNPQKDPANDFLAWKPTVLAAKDAYAQAGITDPGARSTWRVHDCFSLTELLTYSEDLGFCEKGAGRSTCRRGASSSGASCRSTPTAVSRLRAPQAPRECA